MQTKGSNILNDTRDNAHRLLRLQILASIQSLLCRGRDRGSLFHIDGASYRCFIESSFARLRNTW